MRRVPALLAVLILAAGCGGSLERPETAPGREKAPANAPPPPPTRTDGGVVETLHGRSVEDPYRWLEEGGGADVQHWADAQVAYTRGLLDARPSRAALRARLEELASIGRIGGPRVYGKRVFFWKRSGKENQPSIYMREGFDGEPKRVLDPNTMSADATVAIDWWHPSRDGRLIAYGTSEGGSEKSTLRIRDVETGQDLSDAIPDTRHASVEWLKSGSGFFYTRYPAGDTYNRRVYYHKLGTDPAEDPLIFGRGRAKEDSPAPTLSADDRWLVVNVYQGWSKSEAYIFDREGDARWVPVVEGVNAVFSAWVDGGRLYIHTNDGSPRFRLMVADPARPGRSEWKELIAPTEGTLDSVVVLGDRIVAQILVNAHARLRVYGLDGAAQGDIALPTLGTVPSVHSSPGGSDLVFDFQSFFVPPALYRYDATNGATTLFDRVEADLDTTAFESKQIWFNSKDGTKVPMFLVHRKGIVLDGSHPTLLYGYGGFSQNMTPYFGSALRAWLERGGVYAMANLRGGGEFGEEWHQAGMLSRKQNTFDDYIAAAEWLIAQGYTTSARLAGMGGSNGGLLVGAALTQRPELFRAIVCAVPLLDMVRYPKFLLARYWIPEYGDPDKPEDFAWLHAYSPYHRVRAGTAYPAVLLTTGGSDSRVDPLHARKMCARLQAATGSGRPVLLRMEKKAGHGAGKPLSKALDEMADEYSFIMWQLGME